MYLKKNKKESLHESHIKKNTENISKGNGLNEKVFNGE